MDLKKVQGHDLRSSSWLSMVMSGIEFARYHSDHSVFILRTKLAQ